ncbi:MAG: hypothetical protein Q7T49_00560 [bacterium]|nr:hypothetical protein [bacterium]
MKTNTKKSNPNELAVTMAEFLKLYNQTIPPIFPRVSAGLLKKYKDEHTSLFKTDDLWSIDLHRKKIMDWLPNNLKN